MILLLRIAALLALMIAVGGPAAWAQALESTDVTVDPTAANEPSVEPTVEPGEGANRGGAGGVTPLVQVASGFSDIFDAEALPAGGAGLRYQLTRD